MPFESRLDIEVTDAAVHFSFTVRNTGTAPVTLTFPNGHRADVAVYERDTEVWRWSDDKLFVQAIQSETLAPDASLVHEAVWDTPAAGSYTAEASLMAEDTSVIERTDFQV